MPQIVAEKKLEFEAAVEDAIHDCENKTPGFCINEKLGRMMKAG